MGKWWQDLWGRPYCPSVFTFHCFQSVFLRTQTSSHMKVGTTVHNLISGVLQKGDRDSHLATFEEDFVVLHFIPR